MINSTAKKGRPQGFYRTSWGERIDGLTRLSDGRWKVSGPKPVKFTEADERLAVQRFHMISGKTGRPNIHIPAALATSGDQESIRAAIKSLRPEQPTTPLDPAEALAADLRGGTHPAPIDRVPNLRIIDGRLEFGGHDVQPAVFWPWLRRLILDQPKLVAQMTGIEQIGYLADLSKPTASPTLDEMIEVYTAKPGLSRDEVTRCRRFWGEFADIVGGKTIRELTHEQVERYEVKLTASDLSPKSIKHRYTGVRTVVAYAMKRGKGVEDCRRALDVLAMLEVEGVNTLDPNPILPADFWKIHAEAGKAGDKTFAAMLLFALNFALYSSEVGAVRWDEVDLDRGEFVTRRRKTGVPRVGVLWPETIKALKTLPRNRETVFNTSMQGQGFNRCSAHRRWTEYRVAAGFKGGVTFAQIRDAAFTSACRVDLDAARVLAGHRLPGAVDHYVLRDPGFVRDVCEAIRNDYRQTAKATKRRR